MFSINTCKEGKLNVIIKSNVFISTHRKVFRTEVKLGHFLKQANALPTEELIEDTGIGNKTLVVSSKVCF